VRRSRISSRNFSLRSWETRSKLLSRKRSKSSRRNSKRPLENTKTLSSKLFLKMSKSLLNRLKNCCQVWLRGLQRSSRTLSRNSLVEMFTTATSWKLRTASRNSLRWSRRSLLLSSKKREKNSKQCG